MSVDTISRIVTFSVDNIMTPNSYLYNDLTMNDGTSFEDQGAGPYIEIDVIINDDDVSAVGASNNDYAENGVVVFDVYDERGSGTRDPYTIKEAIRDAFRASPAKGGYTRLLSASEGNIIFTNIVSNPAVEINRRRSDSLWMKHTIIISYEKTYEKSA
jgi:hypothetical protein